MKIDYELEQFSPALPENASLSHEQLLQLFEEFMIKLAKGEEVVTRKNKIPVQIFPEDKQEFIEDVTSDAFLGYFYNGVKLGYIKFPDLAQKSKIYSKLEPQDKERIKQYILSLIGGK